MSILGVTEIEQQVLQQGSRRFNALGKRLSVCDYSPKLQRAVVDFGAEDSYELASQRLKVHHNLSLSATTVRKITLYHARRIQSMQEPSGTVGEVAAKGQDVITAQADGTMLPIVEIKEASKGDLRKHRTCQWKEFRLCGAQAHGSTQTHYGVSQGDVNQAGYVWADTVANTGWGLNSKIHVVCDGATWLTHQAQENFGGQASVLIDFYHLSEYLAAAAAEIKASPKQAKRWLHTQQKRLKAGHAHKTITALSSHLAETSQPGDTDSATAQAHRYMNNRTDQLDYKTAIEQGLPIGSGLIEGAHRHILHKRLKLSGAWWKIENASAIAHLRVARANNTEQQYWDNIALHA